METLIVKSPAGPLELTAHDGLLCGVSYAPGKEPGKRQPTDPVLTEAARQLEQFFAGAREQFELPLGWDLITAPFMRAVLEETAAVPYGERASYAEIASRAGNPGAVRAAGRALRRNPLAIVVPCHRIVRSDGKLGNYSGAPDDGRKSFLLEHEEEWAAARRVRRELLAAAGE